ncbi:class I SAM-dependent methyltransferase [Rhodobacteraceae bacterium N5(2021)]|uniref:Class I SAM-dependent methyltransferase n=1 Tax=Gymnodinialimonas phycosphaerae TaxID=2841589 RepID=A0A975TVJ8_9RHOB|nr:class I SAM-dependent methyltransferase [Gymnodinialimonas phycosphaerae]MBY4891718.1 class I SAM-dependent methyltransferase [Gymnodinialimonas phycosphaerae]
MGVNEQYFWSNEGTAIDKWHSYLPVYDRYFAPFRDKVPRMLEIGVQNGGSMQMWRDYFGPDAVLFGIDIEPECAKLNGLAGQVRIGSQADRAFLKSVIDEMGGVDIVLDDGSHQMSHIRASLQTLMPLLSENGLYFIEDLACSYWGSFGGGRGRPGTTLEMAKDLIDDMHHWYHDGHVNWPEFKNMIGGMHIHDQILLLDKASVPEPKRTMRGTDRPVWKGPPTGGTNGSAS